MTYKDTCLRAVDEYLATLQDGTVPGQDAEGEILKNTRKLFGIHNSACAKDEKWKKPIAMTFEQTAYFLSRICQFRRVVYDGASIGESLLCMYVEDGRDAGLYVDAEEIVKRLINKYTSATSAVKREVYLLIKEEAEAVPPTSDPDLVAVNNGIFDFRNKRLLPFSPDHVFLGKCPVDYVPKAVSPVIHNPDDGTDWEIEDWMRSLSDNPEIVGLLWEILGAAVRPNVRWDKVAFLLGENAGNGKSTFCDLCKALSSNAVDLSMHDFGDRFGLDKLMGASAIICEENNVADYLGDGAKFKKVITGEQLTVDRKYKSRVSFRFSGLVVQASNGLPRLKKHDEGFYRRFLIIPFTKSFKGTANKKYIRQKYITRKDVLEYVLRKVLNMNYYELAEPDVCKDALAGMKTQNDPVIQFLGEVLPELKWDLVPWAFLYDLYKAWMKAANPSGRPVSRNEFTRRVRGSVAAPWTCTDAAPVRPSTNNLLGRPEPLIMEYNLTEWMNQTYKGLEPDKLCVPSKINNQQKVRGIMRV